MAIKNARRPCRILRNDSGDLATIGGGTIDSFGAPSYGFGVITIFMVNTAACTLQIFQRLRTSSAWAVTDTFVLAGAGITRTAVQVTGEHVRALFTDTSGAPQTPQIVIGLA